MNMSHKLTAILAVSVALAGCSDSDSGNGTNGATGVSFKEHERVAAIPAQIATIEITDPLGILAAPGITINQDDNVIELDASVSTNGVDTVTVNMAMLNNTGRILFNPKVIPTALSQGLIGTNTLNNTDTIESDAPEFAGLEYYGFGLRGVPDGGAASAEDSMQINGIVSIDNGDGTVSNSPLVIQIAIPTNHSMAYHNGDDWGTIERVDVMGQRTTEEWYDNVQRGGAFQDDNNYHQGAQSHDGRFLYLGTRNLPVIMVHDTTTNMQNDTNPRIDSIWLLENPNEQGFTSSVSMSPNGQYLYASVTTGTHEYAIGSPGSITSFPSSHYLIKVDATSRKVISRLEVTMPGYEGKKSRARNLSITEDGKTGSLAMDFTGGILLVDLNGNMKVIGHFDTMANGYGDRIRETAISPDGSRIFFPDSSEHHDSTYSDYTSSDHIGVINVETGAYSKLLVNDTITDSPRQFEFGPDGRLYHVGDSSQINVYNVNTMSQVAVYDETSYKQFAFDGEGKYLYAIGSDTDIYDITTDSYTDLSEGSTGAAFGFVSPY